MAKPRGLYTPVYASLPRHAKVQAAAEVLRCDRHKLLGHLVTFWTWCLGSVADGAPISAAAVALGAEWPARQAERFADVLADVGLLERVEGGFTVHEWDEYGGKVAAIQQYDRKRHIRGDSPEVPRSLPGNSPLDETRRDETKEESTPKRAKRVTEVDEPFRAEMVAKYQAEASDERVRAEIDDALGHTAASKRHDQKAYVRVWLSRTRWSSGTSTGRGDVASGGGYARNGGGPVGSVREGGDSVVRGAFPVARQWPPPGNQ